MHLDKHGVVHFRQYIELSQRILLQLLIFHVGLSQSFHCKVLRFIFFGLSFFHKWHSAIGSLSKHWKHLYLIRVTFNNWWRSWLWILGWRRCFNVTLIFLIFWLLAHLKQTIDWWYDYADFVLGIHLYTSGFLVKFLILARFSEKCVLLHIKLGLPLNNC